MPKHTFMNLSTDKRNHIETAARKIFIKHPYKKVTISLIVKEVGIPRGSFYQYFNDLEDLYQFVFEQTLSHYEHFASERLRRAENKNVFDFMIDAFASDYAFLSRTDYHAMMRKSFKERHITGVNIDIIEQRKAAFYETLLETLDTAELDGLKKQKRIKVLHLMSHLKFQQIHKIIAGTDTFETALADYTFYLKLLRDGVRGSSHA